MILKHLAWRHRGKLVKLALVALVAATLAIVMSAFVLSTAMSGALTVLVGSEEVCEVSGGPGGGPGSPNGDPNYVSQEPSGQATADIPAEYLPLYQKAGEESGLDWTVLAGTGKVESDHGRNGADSYAGAQGPMQFMPDTWSSIGLDGNGDGTKDVEDPADAIPAAASYLVELGAPGDYADALCQYNAGGGRACASYPQDVLGYAESYRAAEEENSVPALILPSELPSGLPGGLLGDSGFGSSLGASLGSGLSSSFDTTLEFIGPGVAQATQNSWDRVDENMNLHYEESTQYDDALQKAVDEWNALGTVNISPSPSPEETDIWIMDGGDAETQGSSGGLAQSDGQTFIHAANIADNTFDQQVGVIGHEIGHQLGLDHAPGGVVSIMHSPPDAGYVTDYDKQEYYARHGEAKNNGGSGGGSGGGDGQGQGEGGGAESGAVFPLPKDSYEYQDDWGADRPTYGGNHEGTDIFADDGTPISSVTDGKVVKNEWTELGGWTLLIEATRAVGPVRAGDTLYYAHQLEQSPAEVGATVAAGDQIGKVGSTGEGPPGTLLPEGRGKHLHLGWYDETGNRAEAASGAMNPYPLLQWLEENGGKRGPGEPLVASGPCPEQTSPNNPGGPGGPPGGPGAPGGGKMNGTGTGKQVVEEAKKYIGTPYVLGTEAQCIPYEQMDCTCLTLTVFKEFGVDMPDLPLGQWEYGDPVEGEPLAGDLLIWDDPGDGTYGHSAISLGNGDIIHANTGTGDTSITPFWDVPQYLGARRLVGD